MRAAVYHTRIVIITIIIKNNNIFVVFACLVSFGMVKKIRGKAVEKID